ncbi:MAG: hypothetical protein CVU42_11065 [Chloroflexi bacterium HGW-Chloroflexi-4]|jgi:hypothetical protein|nr:MAG: hypothetical protein CVU42_11065 [Chloroflexi bacterium HGW-Chloroflexi-4]
MNDLTSGLIVVVVTGVLIGVIFLLVASQKKRRAADLANLASKNGWRYEAVEEPLTSGWRLSKGEWVIEALNQTTKSASDNSNSSTVNSATRWFTSVVRMPDGMVIIGPHQPDINFGGLGEAVKMVALRLMIGNEFDDAIGIERVELGSLELMARYMVYTNREETAKKLLDQPLENALLVWPMKLPPVVKFSPAGIEIKVQGQRLYKEQELVALVKLGNSLLDSAFQLEKGN